jgi:membrane-associated phospholipid phosphatase
VDLITLAYLLALSIIMAVFHRGLTGWGWYVAAHLTVALGILCLVWAEARLQSWQLTFIRHWYAAVLFFPLFSEMNQIVNIVFPFWANEWLIHLDHALFGVHPSIWLEQLAKPALTDLMVVFYLAYYLLIPLAGLPLYLRGHIDRFHSLLFNTALAFYISYIAFLFFPAESPRLTLAHLQTGPMEGGHLLPVLYFLQGFGGIRGGAFPSSHVAAAFAILLSAYRYERRVFYLMLPFVLGLAVSTTYCRYHYAVDAIAGALLGMACYLVGQDLYRRWEENRMSLSRRPVLRRARSGVLEPQGELAKTMVSQGRNHVPGAQSQVAGVSEEADENQGLSLT